MKSEPVVRKDLDVKQRAGEHSWGENGCFAGGSTDFQLFVVAGSRVSPRAAEVGLFYFDRTTLGPVPLYGHRLPNSMRQVPSTLLSDFQVAIPILDTLVTIVERVYEFRHAYGLRRDVARGAIRATETSAYCMQMSKSTLAVPKSGQPASSEDDSHDERV